MLLHINGLEDTKSDLDTSNIWFYLYKVLIMFSIVNYTTKNCSICYSRKYM